MSQQINLFSPVFLHREKIFSFKIMLEALGLIVLGAAGAYGFAWYQMATLSYRVDAAQQRVDLEELRLTRLVKEISSRETSPQLEQQLAEIQSRADAKRQVADALKEGAPALGPAEHMRAFARQSMGGVWLTGFSLAPAGSGLALRGRALSADLVPAYLGRLNREPVLQGGQFAALEISVPAAGPAAQTVPYVEFRLQAVKPEGSR